MSTKVRVSGIGIMLVGLWGALVPFIGPSFGYQMGGSAAWTWSESAATLHLIPGIAAILGGALMLGVAHSRMRLGAVLALLGGAWFILGPTFRPAWAGVGNAGMTMGGNSGGMMMGSSVWSQIASSLGYHYGTGVVIAALAAYALGALAVQARTVPNDAAPAVVRPSSGATAANKKEPASVA